MNTIRFLLVAAISPVLVLQAASSGSGLVTGTVLNDLGKPVANAILTLENKASGHRQAAVTDAQGHYSLFNVPFNDYHLDAKAPHGI